MIMACNPTMAQKRLELAAGLIPELSLQIATTTAAMYQAPATQLPRDACEQLRAFSSVGGAR